jgi:DNA-binding transcriptional LysR family regulator
MKKLSYKQIEVLWTIATAGSVSTAAKQLDVTQPAISRMLAQTEAQAGIHFFERIRGRLRPTKELNDLLPEIAGAQKSVQRVNDMARAIADSHGGVLKVASNPSLGKHVMPDALAAFHKQYPDTFLRFHTAPVQEIAPQLLSGEVDVALLDIPAEHPFLSSSAVCDGRMVVVVAHDGPLARFESLSLREIAKHPQILVGERLHFGMLVASAFSHAGITPHVFADVPWSDLACAMVNTGTGCAIVDEFCVARNVWPNVKVIPLEETISIRMQAVHAVNRPLSTVAKRFIGVVKSVYEF